ncbi:MAG: DUF3574 domain-containing protein [Methylococcaceae bacterium]|nr:DUF3574 domain-containing protein [Methylococcaceae bacterium]
MLAVILITQGCSTRPGWSRYEMYFGLSTDSGHTRIPDQQWQAFRDQEIVSRFPDGFTLYRGNGYWRNDFDTYREPSELLMVVAPDIEATQKKLNEIAQAYIQRFHQQAVLQIKSQAVIRFHSPAKLEGATPHAH